MSHSIRPRAFPDPGHDHGLCVRDAILVAEEHCRRRGARLTALRRRVLELVWDGHGPVGAYALLESLRGEGHSAAPPTVYRALDFLMAHGLVHRIERMNAYLGCPRPGERHSGQFLICGKCAATAELNDPRIAEAVATGAAGVGFRVRRQTVEVEGLCPACAAAEGTHGDD